MTDCPRCKKKLQYRELPDGEAIWDCRHCGYVRFENDWSMERVVEELKQAQGRIRELEARLDSLEKTQPDPDLERLLVDSVGP